MSVTRPTPKVPPLEDALVVALLLLAAVVLLLDAAGALELVLLLLLLLPHAASPRASAPVQIATRLRSLILPITVSPFLKTGMGNHNL
ncbi:MAG: hypothetical protein JO023_23815 [Chloroflexi bacterium]|nr:hypothetical protein [Chloroflexota bacterium]